MDACSVRNETVFHQYAHGRGRGDCPSGNSICDILSIGTGFDARRAVMHSDWRAETCSVTDGEQRELALGEGCWLAGGLAAGGAEGCGGSGNWSGNGSENWNGNGNESGNWSGNWCGLKGFWDASESECLADGGDGRESVKQWALRRVWIALSLLG